MKRQIVKRIEMVGEKKQQQQEKKGKKRRWRRRRAIRQSTNIILHRLHTKITIFPYC